MAKNRQHSEAKRRQDQSSIGGREFGQVIEPTQAQMASENKGLADDFGKQRQSMHSMKKPSHGKHKAA